MAESSEQRYYLIAYQAKPRHGNPDIYSVFNQVIDESPMSFIQDIKKRERAGLNLYYNFVITMIHEISKEEYEKYCDAF